MKLFNDKYCMDETNVCITWKCVCENNDVIKVCMHIRDESHKHESILFGFPGRCDDAIVINYCILYAKYYIYLEKLKENKNQNTFNIDFLGYLSKLKYILKTEKSICTHNNQSIKFNKFNFIYDNL